MRLKLTGPREGRTEKIRGIQFVEGYADYHCLPRLLERYYGVVQEYVEEEENEDGVQEGEKEEDEQITLQQLIEQKKSELNRRLKTMDDFEKFNSFRAYVKDLTGINPRGGKQADTVMKAYAEQHGLIYEVEE